MKKIIRKLLLMILIIVFILTSINLYIIISTKNKILTIDEIDLDSVDCVLVLGAGIKNNNPSPMLKDRLLTSIELYEQKIVQKILVSGDHTKNNYDEVNVMKNFLIDNSIPSEDIFMDHAGIATYDSIYRAKKIFKANKIIIVTQEYHLYRALYIAKKLNVEAIGISTNEEHYFGQLKREIREYFARVKDFIKCIIKPQSTYLGESFNIKGNGDKTND